MLIIYIVLNELCVSIVSHHYYYYYLYFLHGTRWDSTTSYGKSTVVEKWYAIYTIEHSQKGAEDIFLKIKWKEQIKMQQRQLQ